MRNHGINPTAIIEAIECMDRIEDLTNPMIRSIEGGPRETVVMRVIANDGVTVWIAAHANGLSWASNTESALLFSVDTDSRWHTVRRFAA